MKKSKGQYHHGNLADSLLDAVDEMATKFGLEAVTLRGCAKITGVSPSSAFRHYADKRALLTAFATRALKELSAAMDSAANASDKEDAFAAVGMAYVTFALDKPALFRAMWKEESLYSNDPDYCAAARELSRHLTGGFAETLADDNPQEFSSQELLAWASVHGLANLMIDGPVAHDGDRVQKLARARDMIQTLKQAMESR